METQYARYLYRTTGTDNITELIHGTRITHSSMSRYLSGERKLPIAAVVAMSDKYNLSLLDSMVAAGFITETQLEKELRRRNIAELTDQELAAEVLRRLEAAASSQLATEMDEPVSLSLRRGNMRSVTKQAAKGMSEDVPEGTP